MRFHSKLQSFPALFFYQLPYSHCLSKVDHRSLKAHMQAINDACVFAWFEIRIAQESLIISPLILKECILYVRRVPIDHKRIIRMYSIVFVFYPYFLSLISPRRATQEGRLVDIKAYRTSHRGFMTRQQGLGRGRERPPAGLQT